MGNLEWWNYLIVTLILGIIFFIGGHVQTCYYPFLLTRKFYIVIKNPKLQKILISDIHDTFLLFSVYSPIISRTTWSDILTLPTKMSILKMSSPM